MSKIIPRFLYHLTNKANYESIMSSGVLKTSHCDFIEGIFATELTNLFKRWCGSKDWASLTDNLQDLLIKQVSHDGSAEIVALKIPTEKLKIGNLRIRSQNRFFNELDKLEKQLIDKLHEREAVVDAFRSEELKRIQDSTLSSEEYLKKLDALDAEIAKRFPIPKMDEPSSHLLNGATAKERKLFQQRKEAIEYIYKEDIPISDIEKIGEVNIDELRKTAEYNPLKPMRSIFSALLRGTPEEKGALLLNY